MANTNDKQVKVENFLQKHGIEYKIYSHPPIFTVKDSRQFRKNVPGMGGKSLFLKDSRHHRYYLLSLSGKRQANIKKFCRLINAKKLTFGRPDELEEKLGLTPGSVSPFGLINDKDNKVTFYLDKEMSTAEKVAFHPNINTATLVLNQTDFRRFFELVRHKINIVDIAI